MAVAPDPLAVEEVRPSLDEARELARSHGLVPLQLTFIEDCETPVSAYLKLRAMAAGEPAFLLESADQGQVGRWSFIGVRPREVLRWNLGDGGDPYELAAALTLATTQAPLADAPPFTGGAVGFFGYDLVRAVEPLGPPPPDVLGLPDMALMLTDTLVAFDHLRHTVTIIANADVRDGGDIEGAYGRALEAIAAVRAALAGPLPRLTGSVQEPPEFVSNMGAERFEEAVARIVRYIHAGDAFQVVPSQRWSADVPVEAFSIYRGLRTVNPSPYMYFLDFGDFQVVGASPEPLVTVTGRRVTTKPIAGTRPRGERPEEDRRLAAELLADEKERAEHVMLVDLGRNDLGRVCEYGTVHVDELMEIEYYSHVMHIVSSVSARCARTSARSTRCAAVLPAGTLSGAPKFRAMQIIDELEPVKRGGYGGAVGYLSYAGDLDTAIHIRTVVIAGGRAHVQAGGGTVADARPDAEQRESVAKTQAVLRADGAGLQAAGVAMKVLVLDNYDSFTYNLVQYLGELGSELVVVRNDQATVAELLAGRLRPLRRLTGSLHAQRGGHLARAGGRDAAPGDAGARRLPRPPGTRAGLRRHRPRPRARARQGDDGGARRPHDLRGVAVAAAGRPLPLADRRRRPARVPGTIGVGRWDRDGPAPPRASRRGRPVPPGVDPH